MRQRQVESLNPWAISGDGCQRLMSSMEASAAVRRRVTEGQSTADDRRAMVSVCMAFFEQGSGARDLCLIIEYLNILNIFGQNVSPLVLVQALDEDDRIGFDARYGWHTI